jgi:hypothetical protein
MIDSPKTSSIQPGALEEMVLGQRERERGIQGERRGEGRGGRERDGGRERGDGTVRCVPIRVKSFFEMLVGVVLVCMPGACACESAVSTACKGWQACLGFSRLLFKGLSRWVRPICVGHVHDNQL